MTVQEDIPLSSSSRNPSPLDVEIGNHLRLHRRTSRVKSQDKLGEKVGVTFQQIQKYEKGSNRLSVAMMIRLCEAMNIDPLYFIGGISRVNNSSDIQTEHEFVKLLGITGALELMRSYAAMPPKDRENIRKLSERVAGRQ